MKQYIIPETTLIRALQFLNSVSVSGNRVHELSDIMRELRGLQPNQNGQTATRKLDKIKK